MILCELMSELLERNKVYSDDPINKTSAVIVTGDGVRIWGANRLPIGIYPDYMDLRLDENRVYLECAAKHAIYECARHGISTEGATMYMSEFPCVACARAIVNTGISKLFCKKPTDGENDKSRYVLRKGRVMVEEYIT